MNMAGRKWGAVIILHLLLYGFLYYLFAWTRPSGHSFWFFLALPYADAGLLGIWLAAGASKGWIRLSVTLVGLSCLIALTSAGSTPFHVQVLFPSLATTYSSAALLTLGLGCLGSLFPSATYWQVRFALWELVATVCLLGVAMGILRAVTEVEWLGLDAWLKGYGGQYLTFGLMSGLFVASSSLPLLLTHRWARWGSGLGVLGMLSLLPLVDTALFRALGLAGGDLELFYRAHAGQLFVAWLTLFLFNDARGGLFPRRDAPEKEHSANMGRSKPRPEDATHEEFFDLP